MNVPPQWEQPSQSKGRNAALWVVLAVAFGGCVICCPFGLSIFLPVLSQAKDAAKLTACNSHLKQIGLALAIYAGDFDDRWPDSGSWMDRAEPYLPKPESKGDRPALTAKQIFSCPAAERDGYGYAMVSKLGGTKTSKPEFPAHTILIFETADLTRNAHSDEVKPPVPSRHMKRNVYLFADGHTDYFPDTADPSKLY
ncbi:MAG TPA: hypothetical protein VG944_20445 [Fimbriimonas sp.]|nr:hypothetical protein [Fimbriimonas sp.]